MQDRQKVLFQQLHSYREEMLDILKDLTEEQANRIPEDFHNNIRWNVGHIYLDQYLWIQAVTKEETKMPDRFNEWFGFGTSPANFTEDTPSFEELVQLLAAQPFDIQQKYGDRLEQQYEAIEMGMYTIEQVLIRTIYHEGLHTATIQYIKRFL